MNQYFQPISLLNVLKAFILVVKAGFWELAEFDS